MFRFLRKSQLSISEELRHIIKCGLKNEVPLSPNIFDPMQQNVEAIIRDQIYPAFLCSEMYIHYIQQMTQSHDRCRNGVICSGSGSSSGASCGTNLGSYTIQSSTPSTASKLNTTISNVAYGNLLSGFSVGPLIPTGTCSASGSLCGPSTSASSSGSASATDTLPRSSTLPTLHEDSELSLCDDFGKLKSENTRCSMEMPVRLTHDLLLATQKRRLEIRPPG